MITVKELIEKLQTVDPNLVVLVPGYEGGFREVVFSEHVREFNKYVYTEWYYGSHEEAREGSSGDFKGILL
jgi:hypothetical protein